MIQITCTSCKKAMRIDDAFAGGVCRCQFCGTIQTVPAAASRTAQSAVAGAAKGPKTLFENKTRSAAVGTGSGLDDLADVVHSSGLTDDRLQNKSASGTGPGKNLMPIVGIAAVVIILLLALTLMLVFRGSAIPHQSAANAAATGTPAQAAPSFCGLTIDQPVVVFLIDNGSSSDAVLDAVKSALFHSLDSLGPDQRFQVLFWNPDSAGYPTGTQTAFAVKDNIDAAKSKLRDVGASGSTDPLVALQYAIADNPSQIILVTAKAGDLDDSLIERVMAARGSSTVRIDAVAINGVPGDSVLAKIADRTGGKFLPLPEAQLKSFAY
jgi:hypothetical protein